jgi:hypothetical protein
MRNTALACIILVASVGQASAWSCAGGTCSGPNWAATGAGDFTGAGEDYSPPPVYYNYTPPRVPRQRSVAPGHDPVTGNCYDLDLC